MCQFIETSVVKISFSFNALSIPPVLMVRLDKRANYGDYVATTRQTREVSNYFNGTSLSRQSCDYLSRKKIKSEVPVDAIVARLLNDDAVEINKLPESSRRR